MGQGRSLSLHLPGSNGELQLSSRQGAGPLELILEVPAPSLPLLAGRIEQKH